MSSGDLLSSTPNWPSKGLSGIKSSVLQTTESDLVKQSIVTDHMRNHYRRLHGARSAVDSKPPKAMILGQKCRDRARKEMAQLAYTENLLNQYSGGTPRSARRTLSQSARSRNMVQSQPATFRARSRSVEGNRMMTRSLNVNGSTQNLNRSGTNDTGIASKLFGDPAISQALTVMAAIGKMTSTERNKSSADVLDKHADAFSQPNPNEYKPRLVKRDGSSFLSQNRTYYNPPRKAKSRPASATKEQATKAEDAVVVDENKKKEDEQLALSKRRVREQLNRSLEIRENVEKKIKKAKGTVPANTIIRKQSDEVLKGYGLTENERLQYVRFMQEITDAIIRNNLTTESAIEKLFEIHIDQNREKLDERRLRGLLQALKEDLGVLSSRKGDTYASVKKATNYDNEPPPSRRPSTLAREDPVVLTPTTPHSNRRRSSFDINEPLPWQSETDADKEPRVKSVLTNESRPKLSNNDFPQNTLSDDYLFSAPTVVKPKPRSTLQTTTHSHVESRDKPDTFMSEQEFVTPKNFNTTIRAPMTELNNIGWLSDLQSTKVDDQKSFPHHIEQVEDAVNDDEQNSPSPLQSHRRESDTYGSNDFEENNNSEQ